ncbi:MAG: hypothetical protein IJ538_03315 [Clostridia bacterium]|nr:hypothetical protein [Clostridia bacterium]
MVLYLSIIIISVIIISVCNIFFGGLTHSAWLIILMSAGGAVFEFAIDGIFAILVKIMPAKWFEKNGGIYNVSRLEQKFYAKIKVRAWKDKVWELGGMGGFRKNKLADPKNPEYIDTFLMESNKGVLIHILGVIAGFCLVPVVGFVFSWKAAIQIAIPIAAVNVFLNCLSIFVLRYNTPKLLTLKKYLTKKAA